MYSSEDFERLFIRYKGEAYPKGESIQPFCHRNNTLQFIREMIQGTRWWKWKFPAVLRYREQIRQRRNSTGTTEIIIEMRSLLNLMKSENARGTEA